MHPTKQPSKEYLDKQAQIVTQRDMLRAYIKKSKAQFVVYEAKEKEVVDGLQIFYVTLHKLREETNNQEEQLEASRSDA